MRQQPTPQATALRRDLKQQSRALPLKPAPGAAPARPGRAAAAAQPKMPGAPTQAAAHNCRNAGCAAHGAGPMTRAANAATQPGLRGRNAAAPQLRNANGAAPSLAARRLPAQNGPGQANGMAQTQRTAAQPRAATPQRFENRTLAATAKVGSAAGSPRSAPSRGPDYMVHPPTPVGGGLQQIKVTIRGTQQIAGSVNISPTTGGKIHISDLKVERQFRQRGIASQLMNAAISAARNQGFSGARLEARPFDSGISPQALVSMYRKMGFKSVGKSGRGSPLMERHL